MENSNKGLRDPIAKRAGLALFMGLFVLVSEASLAACVKNDAGRNLFIVMASDAGRIERSFLSRDRLCQPAPDGEQVRVSILPYGGARFGCRIDLVGDEISTLLRFDTMNKCKFKSDR